MHLQIMRIEKTSFKDADSRVRKVITPTFIVCNEYPFQSRPRKPMKKKNKTKNLDVFDVLAGKILCSFSPFQET